MASVKLALVGLGKIARDQHLPALAASGDFALGAIADPRGAAAGAPAYADLPSLLQAVPDIAAVSLCTPPQVRYPIARLALEHGLHVMLEKPPGVTVGEVQALAALARKGNLALFASWHSRHARGVDAARAWLEQRRILSIAVNWKEDVRVWHPGQAWIWQAGGLGVFDPGINALSILTHIVPGPLVMEDAELCFPGNCATPIAARLQLRTADGAGALLDFDFLQTGTQTWDIDIATDSGRLRLSQGGSILAIDGRTIETPERSEYAELYRGFAQRIARRQVDADAAPLQLVADAFLRGRRIAVGDYIE